MTSVFHVLRGVSDLGGSSDHVLDEVPVSRGIDDGDVVLAGLKLPQGDVNGDATLPFSFQLIQHPSVFKGALPHLRNTRITSL